MWNHVGLYVSLTWCSTMTLSMKCYLHINQSSWMLLNTDYSPVYRTTKTHIPTYFTSYMETGRLGDFSPWHVFDSEGGFTTGQTTVTLPNGLPNRPPAGSPEVRSDTLGLALQLLRLDFQQHGPRRWVARIDFQEIIQGLGVFFSALENGSKFVFLFGSFSMMPTVFWNWTSFGHLPTIYSRF